LLSPKTAVLALHLLALRLLALRLLALRLSARQRQSALPARQRQSARLASKYIKYDNYIF